MFLILIELLNKLKKTNDPNADFKRNLTCTAYVILYDNFNSVFWKLIHADNKKAKYDDQDYFTLFPPGIYYRKNK